jgi:hypothetical protein
LKCWRFLRTSVTLRHNARLTTGRASGACLLIGQDLAPRLVCSLGNNLFSRRIGHSPAKTERSKRALSISPIQGVFTLAHLGKQYSAVFTRRHTCVRQHRCYNLPNEPFLRPSKRIGLPWERRAQGNHSSRNTGHRTATGHQRQDTPLATRKARPISRILDFLVPSLVSSYFQRGRKVFNRRSFRSMGHYCMDTPLLLLHWASFYSWFPEHICTCSMRSMDGVLSHSFSLISFLNC